MKRSLFIMIFATAQFCISFNSVSFGQAISKKTYYLDDYFSFPNSSGNPVLTPLNIINSLRLQNPKPNIIFNAGIKKPLPKNWITAEDIEQLMPLIDSKDPCMCLSNPLASTVALKNADAGGYAIELIRSFMKNRPPDFFPHACPRTTKKEVDQLNEWWEGFKGKINYKQKS